MTNPNSVDAEHDNNSNTPERTPLLTKNYLTGLVFIVLVSVIWAASSVLIQSIYDDPDTNFRSPFAVTYIGVSLFTLWIPTHKLLQKLQEIGDSSLRRTTAQSALQTPYRTLHIATAADDAIDLMEEDDAGECLDGDILNSEDDSASATREDPRLYHIWTDRDHLRAAAWIAPVWFIANYTYNASLAYTSITSSTVLASTGSVFTFLFALLTRDEHFTVIKCAGVLLGVAGSIITAWHDVDVNDSSSNSSRRIRWLLVQQQDDENCAQCSIWGDCLGVLSAIGYGTYAVQTRVLCPKDESLYSMQVLLGYIGLLNMVVLAPIMIYQLLTGTTELAWVILGFLVVKGLFDNVLSDYLWLRAVILTNATVATVGLGLTIPLAFASDIVMGNAGVMSQGQVIGALTVLFGFVLVNIGNKEDAAANYISANGGEELRMPESVYSDDSEPGQEVVNLQTIS